MAYSVFCGKCGAPSVDGDDVFCRKCGARLGSAVRPDSSQGPAWDRMPVTTRANSRSNWGRVILALILIVFLAWVAELGLGGKAASGPVPRPIPDYKSDTVTVPAGKLYTFSFPNIKAGNILEGYFITTGGNNDVGFRIQSPSGGYLLDLSRVTGRYDFHIVATRDGPYVLIFDNGFSVVTSKIVNLMYRAY